MDTRFRQFQFQTRGPIPLFLTGLLGLLLLAGLVVAASAVAVVALGAGLLITLGNLAYLGFQRLRQPPQTVETMSGPYLEVDDLDSDAGATRIEMELVDEEA